MNLESIYVSWVDLFAFIILVVGLRNGQKRGLSQEILFVLQWLVIVVVAAASYEPLGRLLAAHSPFSTLFCNVSSYLAVAFVVKLGFCWVRRGVGEKLVESDIFGSGEYYFGMLAGVVRYGCVGLAVLALLNARQFSKSERAAKANYQEVNFGAVFFPSLADVQEEVFDRSWTGRLTQTYLSTILIHPVATDNKKIKRGSMVRAREKAVNDVLEK